jgi:hypothetical protein
MSPENLVPTGLGTQDHPARSEVKKRPSRYRPDRLLEFQEAEAPEFLDNRNMTVVRLSALRTGRLYPQEGFLVLISVRG